MKRFPIAVCTLLAAAGVVETACKKKAPAPTIPAAPVPIILPKEAPKPPPRLPPAPKIESGVPKGPPVSADVRLPPPPEPAKKTPSRTRRRADSRTDVKPQESKTVETPQVSAPAPAPVLGTILTPEQAREHTRRFEMAVERTQSALSIIQTKLLTADQKETVIRIRSFLAQAEQARSQDLVGAANLAERADLLSRDLLSRLQ